MDDNIFSVNLTLSLETYYKAYLSTPVLGWKKDAFLLTEAVYVKGQPANLKSKDPCIIRFLKDGTAYGFKSEVLTVQFFPAPVMFLKYPAAVECLKLRVADRFKTEWPVTLLDASGAVVSEAVMVDISDGGCGLKAAFQSGRDYSPEAGYSIRLKIMDQELSLGCKVKKIDKSKEDGFLGLEFADVSPQDRETLKSISSFIYRNLQARAQRDNVSC